LLRAGFPQYDWVGGYARTWVGYRGARQALFDIANLFLGNHHDTPVHRSIYRVEHEPMRPAGRRLTLIWSAPSEAPSMLGSLSRAMTATGQSALWRRRRFRDLRDRRRASATH
jgi:hypothetical protein